MTTAISIFLLPTIIATVLAFNMPTTTVEAVAKPEEVTEEKAEPPSTPLTIKDYAHSKVDERFGQGHWESFDKLIQKESGWNPNAKNPTSTAQGLGQFLKQTRINYGITVDSTPEEQIDAVIEYISNRYGNPSEAWRFHLAKNWY